MLKLAGCSRVTDTGLAELNERAGAARKTLVRLDVSRLVQVFWGQQMINGKVGYCWHMTYGSHLGDRHCAGRRHVCAGLCQLNV